MIWFACHKAMWTRMADIVIIASGIKEHGKLLKQRFQNMKIYFSFTRSAERGGQTSVALLHDVIRASWLLLSNDSISS